MEREETSSIIVWEPMQNLMMSFGDKLGLRGLGWLILEGALDRKDLSLVTFDVVEKVHDGRLVVQMDLVGGVLTPRSHKNRVYVGLKEGGLLCHRFATNRIQGWRVCLMLAASSG